MTGEAADSKFSTQISLHGIKNIFGEPTQMSLFDRDNVHYLQDAFLERLDQIKRVGSELTEIELRVLEAILKGFSRSGYKGNRPAIKREEILAAKSGGEYQPIFQYVKQIPVLRFRRADLLRWMGVNSTQFSTVSGVFLALSKLAHKQFYYYYERTAQDEEGNLIREGRGWKKEQVSCVGTLFNLEAVNDKDNFLYYDIRLNPIFLDQLNSYFLMIPEDWRREVKALVGKRKVSSYVFVFLMFLRYQYELRRRSPVAQHPYRLEKSPEDIAVGINIPPSIFKKKRKRMREILDECYEVATSLGYLRSFNRLGGIDVLVFDDQKYYNPKHILQDEPENPDDESRQRDAISLFKTFWDYQQSVDSGVIIPKGVIKSRQIRIFTEMLQTRRKEDIERLIKWSVNAKFWCSRLSSPRMLQRNFHQAWMDMLGSRSNKEKNEDVLRDLQREQVKKGFDIICEFCSGSNGQTGARLEVFLIDSDEQQTKLSEHYFQAL
ncbi:MAG: hypothetical protein ACE5GN_04595, partial [Waddliaceae bacterium]